MIIWGKIAKFGDQNSNNQMIYYGILISSIFIGIGFIVHNNKSKKEITRKWHYGYN